MLIAEIEKKNMNALFLNIKIYLKLKKNYNNF